MLVGIITPWLEYTALLQEEKNIPTSRTGRTHPQTPVISEACRCCFSTEFTQSRLVGVFHSTLGSASLHGCPTACGPIACSRLGFTGKRSLPHFLDFAFQTRSTKKSSLDQHQGYIHTPYSFLFSKQDMIELEKMQKRHPD